MADTRSRRIKLAGIRGGATSNTGSFMAINGTAHGIGAVTIEWPPEMLGEIIAAVLMAAERAGPLLGAPDPLFVGATTPARAVHTIEAGVASTRAHVLLRLGFGPDALARLGFLLQPEQARELAARVQEALDLLRGAST